MASIVQYHFKGAPIINFFTDPVVCIARLLICSRTMKCSNILSLYFLISYMQTQLVEKVLEDELLKCAPDFCMEEFQDELM